MARQADRQGERREAREKNLHGLNVLVGHNLVVVAVEAAAAVLLLVLVVLLPE